MKEKGVRVMKISKYNLFIPLNEEEIISYNSYTNALAIVEEGQYKEFLEYESDTKKILDETLYLDLLKGGFIINDDLDELELLRARMYKSRFNKNVLGLTIAPTSDCNFRCIYCYEKDSIRKGIMTTETMNQIIDYVSNSAEGIKKLDVTWYGGEPMLALEEIEYMSTKLLKICDLNDIEYSASMITNGYLLSEKSLKRLETIKVKFLQITIDGDKETHDKRRFLTNGQGSFDKIIDNLVKGKELLPYVSLRINIDKSNYNGIQKLLKLLVDKKLNKYVFPYLGHVINHNDTYNDSRCLTTKDYAKVEMMFDASINLDPKVSYPSLRTSSCTADSINSFVIDVDGTLYRCWDDIGIKELKTGHISNPELNSVFVKYLTQDATLDEKCSNCKILPICMGSCPRYFGEDENCSKYKYTLEDRLIQYVNYNHK